MSSIAEAVVARTALAPIAVSKELLDLHPNANWISGLGPEEFVVSLDEGKFEALVFGWVDVRGNPAVMELFCDRDLVRVGGTISEKAFAFPVHKDWWLVCFIG